jgi:hypothetical protein
MIMNIKFSTIETVKNGGVFCIDKMKCFHSYNMGEEISYSDRYSEVLPTKQVHMHPFVPYKGINSLVIPEFQLYKHISSSGVVDFASSIQFNLFCIRQIQEGF